MLKTVAVKIDEIYVPADRRKELDADKVDEVAEQIMDEADTRPIQVRQGKGRYVLIKGVNRLEAHRALGDDTIDVYIVAAKQF